MASLIFFHEGVIFDHMIKYRGEKTTFSRERKKKKANPEVSERGKD